MAALDEEDVVDVGAGGALVQGQPLETNVSRQVFVKHPCPCANINQKSKMFFLSLKPQASLLHLAFVKYEKHLCSKRYEKNHPSSKNMKKSPVQ